MATKSKSKSKTSTAATKAAKPKLNAFQLRRCEVARIAREYEALSNADWHIRCVLWAKAEKDDKPALQQKLDAIGGTQRGIIEDAAQWQAFSADGAAFQVMVLFDQIRALASLLDANDGAFRFLDRSRRLCHSLLQYFAKAHDVPHHDIGFSQLMGGNTDPCGLSRQAVDHYNRYVAEGYEEATS